MSNNTHGRNYKEKFNLYSLMQRVYITRLTHIRKNGQTYAFFSKIMCAAGHAEGDKKLSLPVNQVVI